MFDRGLTSLVLLLALVSHLEPMRAEEKAEIDYQRQIVPILKQHCFGCHGPEKQEAEIRLDNLSTDVVNDRAAAEHWHEVLNVLNAAEMPPEEAKSLAPEDSALLVGWVSNQVQRALAAGRKTTGRVVLRPLNRSEYHHTMADLLGLDMDYGRDLPPDAVSSEGFTNDGRFLQMSALQLESYLATARRALERVIVDGEAPRVFEHTFTESKIDGWLGDAQRANRLGRRQEFLAKITQDYPEQGDFLVRVKLSAELREGCGYPLLEVSVGYRPDTEILLREFAVVEVTSNEEQTLEFRGRLEDFPLPVRGQGKYPGLVVRVRNVYTDGSPLPKKSGKPPVYPDEPHLPVLNVQSVEFHGPIFEQWPPARHRKILFDSPLRSVDQSAYVRQVLARFMKRAYRRQVQAVEVDAMVDFLDEIRPGFPSLEAAFRETLAFILIRPDFLYHLEPAGDTKRDIDDWELASRMSYFLWSTMPDARLMELAAAGQLRRPKILAQEVERMLQDKRSWRFVSRFAEQWLQLRRVESIAVNRDTFPQFDDALKSDMAGETQHFFGELLRENQSALLMLDSDFTMLNEPLAKHYGVDGIWGRKFRRVPLPPDGHRGGVLGHASVLLSNSTGADSHPVRRAVWIRDRLLGDPPAPPPPDVPSLEEGNPKFHELSIREQLALHRDKEACARCHRKLDPWGLALENFDAVGLWRDELTRKVNGKPQSFPVVAKESFPSGLEIDGADELRNHLLQERQGGFARSLVTRLLTYALGRQLELNDQEIVDDLVEQFAKNEYRLRDLIYQVVSSDLFMTK